MLFGLPQGSVLEPLYILYTVGLSRLLSEKGVTSHKYADYTQAYVHGPASAATTYPS